MYFFPLAKDIFRFVKLRNSVYSAKWLNKSRSIYLSTHWN